MSSIQTPVDVPCDFIICQLIVCLLMVALSIQVLLYSNCVPSNNTYAQTIVVKRFTNYDFSSGMSTVFCKILVTFYTIFGHITLL